MPEQKPHGKLGMHEQKVRLMLADPDMQKVHTLLGKLTKFHWSLKLPQHCVMPSGAGIGRLAYDNIAAFNIAWCYHKPHDEATHNAAIATFVLLREPLKIKSGSLTLEDAVMFLSPDAFKVWLKRNSQAFHPSLVNLLMTAANNCRTY